MAQKRYLDENELRGDGGYQGVSANQFSYSSGSKAVTPVRCQSPEVVEPLCLDGVTCSADREPLL
jgi:hypothetical protein